MRLLSILIPVYNEEKTIVKLLDKVYKTPLKIDKEIVIIDDGSKDNSKILIENYIKNKKNKKTKINFHSKENDGKGSAIIKGIELATGDLIIVQDADLEYDPKEISKLIGFIDKKRYDVVYGSRLLDGKNSYYYFSYYLGNIFLSKLTSLLYNARITDMETCYKLFPSKLIKNIPLNSKGFEIEPEITAKVLKRGYSIGEVSIKYSPRTKKEGKKINWKDGLKAMSTLLKLRFTK